MDLGPVYTHLQLVLEEGEEEGGERGGRGGERERERERERRSIPIVSSHVPIVIPTSNVWVGSLLFACHLEDKLELHTSQRVPTVFVSKDRYISATGALFSSVGIFISCRLRTWNTGSLGAT